MVQIGRHLTDAFDGFLNSKKYLIHDHDVLFTEKFRDLLRSAGTTPWRLPIHMSMMNGYAECFVKTIKQECLDHIIFFSEDALRKTIAEYMVHYHMERPHQGIDNRIIEPEAQTYRNTGRIVIAHGSEGCSVTAVARMTQGRGMEAEERRKSGCLRHENGETGKPRGHANATERNSRVLTLPKLAKRQFA